MKFYNTIAGLWQPLLRLADWLVHRVGTVLVAILTFLTGVIPGVKDIDPMVRDQLSATLAYAPWALISAPLRQRSTPEVDAAKAKAGGFLRGVCHAWDYEMLPEANIEWDRIDIYYPYEEDGVTLAEWYLWRREDLKARHEAGLKTMIVTTQPRAFLENGIDPRTPEGEAKVIETVKFIVEDLKPYIGAVQVANELGVARFTYPLTLEEAVRFLGVQLEALYPIKGDILVGYNTAGPQMDVNSLMKPWLKYCDYVGLDVYIGCFFGVATWMWLFDALVELLWSYTGKPIIVAEFGYIGGGAPKSTAEKNALLMERYGFPDEAAVRADPRGFLRAMHENNEYMAKYVYRFFGDDIDAMDPAELEGFLFSLDFKSHLYCEIPADYVIKQYPHTPEGQAGFYSDCIPRLAKHPFVIGTFIYSWSDEEYCYVCGQPDCPTETRWGLVDAQGAPKPAFYAVQDAYEKLM